MSKNIKDCTTKEEVFIYLRNWIRENKDLLYRKMETEDTFEKPSWSEYQAFLLGNLRFLSKIENIIPDQEERDK